MYDKNITFDRIFFLIIQVLILPFSYFWGSLFSPLIQNYFNTDFYITLIITYLIPISVIFIFFRSRWKILYNDFLDNTLSGNFRKFLIVVFKMTFTYRDYYHNSISYHGNINQEIKYVKGQIQGIKIFYNTGEVLSDIPFKDNIITGKMKIYYKNNIVSDEIEFDNGIMEGHHIIYESNGKEYTIINYFKNNSTIDKVREDDWSRLKEYLKNVSDIINDNEIEFNEKYYHYLRLRSLYFNDNCDVDKSKKFFKIDEEYYLNYFNKEHILSQKIVNTFFKHVNELNLIGSEKFLEKYKNKYLIVFDETWLSYTVYGKNDKSVNIQCEKETSEIVGKTNKPNDINLFITEINDYNDEIYYFDEDGILSDDYHGGNYL